jgi:hypothetical protein
VAVPHANLPDVPLEYGGSGAVLLLVGVVERGLYPAEFGHVKSSLTATLMLLPYVFPAKLVGIASQYQQCKKDKIRTGFKSFSSAVSLT